MFFGLIDPSRVIRVKRKAYELQNVDWINEWDEMCSQTKLLNELQWKNLWEELNKILTSGDTSVEAWVKVSNTMQLKKKSRKWKPDLNMNAFILEFKELNVHGQNKQLLEKRDKLNDKVVNLMEVYIPMLEQGGPIHIIQSEALDFNGFGQKFLIKCLVNENAYKQWSNLLKLFNTIHGDSQSRLVFLHNVVKTIIFEKREQVTKRADLRSIAHLPAWNMNMKKIALSIIK